MNPDDIEFLISQYADGSLPPAQRTAVEQRLARDANAQSLAREYVRLDQLLISLPRPELDWDRFSASIFVALDESHRREEPRRGNDEPYRIGPWLRLYSRPLALAASLAIIAGIGLEVLHTRSGRGLSPPPTIAGVTDVSRSSLATVSLVTDRATGPMQEEVAIGPGAGASPVVAINYDEHNAPAASHVAVASGGAPRQDSVPPLSSFDMQ